MRHDYHTAVRCFTLLCRLFMPRSFYRQFAVQLRDTFRDRYRCLRHHRGGDGVIRFWATEIVGVIRASFDEYVAAFLSRRRKPTRQPSPTQTPRTSNMFASFSQDLRYGFRMIRATPVVSAIAIVSLAIGVSVNTAVFSVLHSWLLRPLPYPNADEIVVLFENNTRVAGDFDPVAPANYFDWVDQSTSLASFTASRFQLANITGSERPEQVTVSFVTPNLFSVLGTDPLIGRTFTSTDGAVQARRVTVLSETLWRNRFGADPDIIDKTITLSGTVHTVVGVIPEHFDFIVGNVNLWIASDFLDVRDDRINHTLTVTARLKPNNTVEQAQSELNTIAARLQEQHEETNADWGINLQTLRETFPGPTDRALAYIVMTVVLLVLVVACANIASLLMAKTEGRQKEMALRVALGAGKWRVIRQLLTESVVMALVGGVLGMVLSVWGIKLIAGAMPEEMPALFVPTFNAQVMAFAVVVSVVAGLTFGITPAMQAIGSHLRTALAEGGRGGTASSRKKRLRRSFVAVEFAVALAVLVGAAILTDIFSQRLNVNLGFRPDNILTMSLDLPEHRYGDVETSRAFTEKLERELDQIPGISASALSNILPRARSTPRVSFSVDGRTMDADQLPRTTWLSVNTDYFATLGIAIRQGRAFSTTDRLDSRPVVIVNRRMGDLHFPDGNAVGQWLTISGMSREIVGVADNIAQRRLTGLEPDLPSVYFPLAQFPVRQLRVILRSEVPPEQLVAPVQNAVWSIDADQPVSAVATLDAHMKAALAGPTILTQLLLVVGALALSLAAIGIYGVMAYTVSTQQGEIGIRMALGAKPRHILMRVTKQGAMLSGLGLTLGIPLSVLVAMGISRILGQGVVSDGIGQIQMISMRPLLAIAGLLVSVGLVAAYLPARRATRVDPAMALQRE